MNENIRADSLVAKQLDFLPDVGGSIPTSALQYHIRPIEKAMANNIYVKFHYLSGKGFLHSYSFGAFYDGVVWGAITYSIPNAFEINGLYKNDKQAGVFEISRLAFHDDCPKNSESRLIGVSLRLLRKFTDVRLVISYADTAQNHVGTIYKATGFICKGMTAQKTDFVHSDGRITKTKGLKYSEADGKWVKRSRKWLFYKFMDQK